jgi:hypothetical protein
MLGERGRLRMQRNRDTGRCVASDHRLGPVIDDRAGHAAEVGERASMAVPKGRQIHAGGETAKRVARVREGHVERIDLADPNMGEQVTLIAPIHPGLSAGHHLEAAVQPGQRVLILLGKLRSDPWPSFG